MAVIVAIAAWIGVGYQRATRAEAPPPRRTELVDEVPVAGTIVALREGVSFVVPLHYTYVRPDEDTLHIGDPRGVKLVVSITTGARLADLPSPEQAADDYAAQNGLTITTRSIGSDRLIVHAEKLEAGSRHRHSLFTFSGRHYRVAVVLVVWGNLLEAPSIARLVSELADGRVIRP